MAGSGAPAYTSHSQFAYCQDHVKEKKCIQIGLTGMKKRQSARVSMNHCTCSYS